MFMYNSYVSMSDTEWSVYLLMWVSHTCVVHPALPHYSLFGNRFEIVCVITEPLVDVTLYQYWHITVMLTDDYLHELFFKHLHGHDIATDNSDCTRTWHISNMYYYTKVNCYNRGLSNYCYIGLTSEGWSIITGENILYCYILYKII